MDSKNKVKINVPWKSLFDSTIEPAENEEQDDLSNEQYLFSEKSSSSRKNNQMKPHRHNDDLSSSEKSYPSLKNPKRMRTIEKFKEDKGDEEIDIDDDVEKEISSSEPPQSQCSPFFFFIHSPISLKSFTPITPEEMKKKWENQKSLLTKDYKNKHKSALKLKKKYKFSSK